MLFFRWHASQHPGTMLVLSQHVPNNWKTERYSTDSDKCVHDADHVGLLIKSTKMKGRKTEEKRRQERKETKSEDLSWVEKRKRELVFIAVFVRCLQFGQLVSASYLPFIALLFIIFFPFTTVLLFALNYNSLLPFHTTAVTTSNSRYGLALSFYEFLLKTKGWLKKVFSFK